MEKKIRFAVIGAGFWAHYQIAAWMELPGIELIAVCDQVNARAENLAHRFKVGKVYKNADEMLHAESLDFIDIISDVNTHASFTIAAAKKGIPVICQKPMAPKLPAAQKMVEECETYGVPFYVHENWRWQAPIRKVKALLAENTIGKVFKARVTFCSAFPVFENQPFLAGLEEFILTDIGSHILDVCRFLFGEASSLECHSASINPSIKGEDVATVFMRMENGSTCYAEMSYASILEYEPFPETFILIEGSNGSIHLTKNYEIHVTTRSGTQIFTAAPIMYDWVDPKYALVHSSIVPCNENLLAGITGTLSAETTGRDNLETVRLVHAAYASARTHKRIELKSF